MSVVRSMLLGILAFGVFSLVVFSQLGLPMNDYYGVEPDDAFVQDYQTYNEALTLSREIAGQAPGSVNASVGEPTSLDTWTGTLSAAGSIFKIPGIFHNALLGASGDYNETAVSKARIDPIFSNFAYFVILITVAIALLSMITRNIP